MELPPTRPTWRRTLEVAVPALVLLVAGLTIVLVAFNDLAAGATTIRERGRAAVVATAVGPLAGDFRWHVWSSVGFGAVLIAVAAALLLVLRFGSPAAREKLLAFSERSRYGNNKRPGRKAQVVAAVAVLAVVYWLSRD